MKYKTLILFASLGIIYSGIATAQHAFTGDPLKNTSGSYVTNAFMQLDNISPFKLHTGIDAYAAQGDSVYPPLPDGNLCKVIAVGADNVYLQSSYKPGGNYACCYMLHINPNYNLSNGSMIGSKIFVGNIQSGHLHFELYISADTSINDADLASPRRNSLDSASFNADSTKPVLYDNTVVHPQTSSFDPFVWEIYAGDEDSGSTNGIGGMELLIDDVRVDGFDLGTMKGKTGNYPPSTDDFYYSTYDTSRAPYKLSWTPSDDREHIWRLRWWDDVMNTETGDPNNQTAVQVSEMGGEIRDGKVYLNWKVLNTDGLANFNIYKYDEETRQSERVSVEPVVEGVADHQFVDNLPENWTTIWYRVTASNEKGAEYIVANKKLSCFAPLLASIKAFPNPSSGSPFQLEIATSREENVRVDVYNVRGERVRTIFKGKMLPGKSMQGWDHKDDKGKPVPAGIYMIRIKGKGEMAVHKIAVTR